jgi:hypothetical protein
MTTPKIKSEEERNKIRPTSKSDVLVRFWNKVKKTKKCWLWIGAIDTDGYGNWSQNKTPTKPHRFSYELHVEKIPKGMVIDHICRVRNCVNPDHLRVVSNRANLLIGEGFVGKNYKKTHCIRGHEFTEENTRWYRNCRLCKICGYDHNTTDKSKEYKRTRYLKNKQKMDKLYTQEELESIIKERERDLWTEIEKLRVKNTALRLDNDVLSSLK